MTTNLLSVIEQLTKAAIYFKEVDPSVRSHCTWNGTTESEAAAAIEAGTQALEQPQGEALNEFFHFGPFIDAAGIRADDKAHVVINKLQSAIQQHFSAKAAHPQATEPAPSKYVCRNCVGQGWEPSVHKGKVPCSFCQPAPSTAGEQVDADDWVVREDILSMARATGAEEVIGNWLFYMTGSHLERFAAALLSAPTLPAAAMPVGELTTERIVEIAEATDKEWYSKQTDALWVAKFARAILAAARTQPVREPLTLNRITEIYKASFPNYDIRSCPEDSVQFVRNVEAAHGIK